MDSLTQQAERIFMTRGMIDAMHLCNEAGIPKEAARKGQAIAEHRREVESILRGIYGDPAFGSWPERAAAERTKMLAQRGVL